MSLPEGWSQTTLGRILEQLPTEAEKDFVKLVKAPKGTLEIKSVKEVLSKYKEDLGKLGIHADWLAYWFINNNTSTAPA